MLDQLPITAAVPAENPGKMQLLAAREFEGTAADWLAKVRGNEERGHGRNDGVHDRG